VQQISPATPRAAPRRAALVRGYGAAAERYTRTRMRISSFFCTMHVKDGEMGGIEKASADRQTDRQTDSYLERAPLHNVVQHSIGLFWVCLHRVTGYVGLKCGEVR
jgi:hypothetical protein